MPSLNLRGIATLLLAVALPCLVGCAANGPDPWEKTNRFFYSFNDGMDRIAFKPAADFYVKIVPREVRTGIGNGFNNLEYFDVILNDFLQVKCDQGLRDAARMAVNSTVGIVGIFDVATPCGLPSHENDFGVTLGKWGAAAGPYLVLPLFGPSSLRDAPGIACGMLTNPVTWVDPPWWISVPLDALEAVQTRASVERYFKFRNLAAIDSYVFTRDAYLQYRLNLILEGKAPDQGIYDEYMEPATAPASQPARPDPAP